MFPQDKMIIIHFQEDPPLPRKCHTTHSNVYICWKHMFTDYWGFLAALFMIWSIEKNVNVKVNMLSIMQTVLLFIMKYKHWYFGAFYC